MMKKLMIVLASLFLLFGCMGSEKKEAAPAAAGSESAIQVKTKGFVEELKKEHAGKVLLVNFFASWCPPCRGETPDFVAAYEKYKDSNFVIVGISVDKALKDVEGYQKEFNVTYPLYHSDNDLAMEMNISTIPTTFIYKPDGKLFDMVVGPLTAKELDIIATSFK